MAGTTRWGWHCQSNSYSTITGVDLIRDALLVRTEEENVFSSLSCRIALPAREPASNTTTLYPPCILRFDKCPGSARNLPFTALIALHSGILLNAYFRPQTDPQQTENPVKADVEHPGNGLVWSVGGKPVPIHALVMGMAHRVHRTDTYSTFCSFPRDNKLQILYNGHHLYINN